MAKVTDVKAYFKDIAAKSGLGEDQIKQVMGVMDDDKFAKAFNDGFKPLPDYSHDLDDVRNRTVEKKDAEYKGWYDKEQAKYAQYLAGLDELKKYQDMFGPIDNPNPNPNPNPNGGAMYLTKEELDKFKQEFQENIARRDNSYLEYLEIREQHMQTFGKTLDRRAFEAAYKEHPEWGSLQTAYRAWVEPEMEKTREAKAKADSDRRYEEGVRDGFSRKAVPADHQPKQFSPMFEQKADVLKMTDREQDTHSRNAFLEGFRDSNKQPA
jgi:hypothetical protein